MTDKKIERAFRTVIDVFAEVGSNIDDRNQLIDFGALSEDDALFIGSRIRSYRYTIDDDVFRRLRDEGSVMTVASFAVTLAGTDDTEGNA
jgi:hypothetical protein